MPDRVSAPASSLIDIALPAIALAAAMVLGGSGSLIPIPEMLLQCLLAALFAAWAWRAGNLRRVPRGAWIVAGVVVALPLLQLLPLPPEVWHGLPGRAMERAALDLVGRGESWQPWSLTPDRTLAALLAMAGPAAVLVMAAAQDRHGRTVLLATIAGLALISVLVGAAQLSGGDGNGFRFYNPNEAFLDGFQTNHNAEADVLLIGMILLAAAAADRAAPGGSGRRRRPVDPRALLGTVGGVSLLLALGVVLTASRTGIALLPLAIGTQALLLRQWLALNTRRAVVAALAIVAMAAVGLGIVGTHHGALARVWARFHITGELRPEIWHDALFALRQYWPWGAGMGSFIPVFDAAERLEVVTPQFSNRAHDDYLEFLIEAGVPGIVALTLVVWQLAKGAWHSWHARSGSSAQIIGAVAALLLISLHSLGDYPLRTMSIACIIAACAGVLLPITQGAEPGTMKRS